MKHIGQMTVALVLVLLALMGPWALADAGGYSIQAYDYEATLSKDAVLHVTEEISVNFFSLRHGIYRAIPLRYEVDNTSLGGGTRTYENEVEHIRVPGQKWQTSIENDALNIRIGDAKQYVTGEQRYVISYDVVLPRDGLDSCDLLYYSLLGDQWGVVVRDFHFRIRFEEPLPAEAAQGLELYSGRYGRNGNELGVEYTCTPELLEGHVESVPAWNAVTIRAVLPEGSLDYRMSPSLRNGMLLAGISALLFAGGMLLAAFRRRKAARALEGISRTPLPPEHLSSAEVGMIIDNSADDIDLLSLIPSWADRGLLDMIWQDDILKLHRKGPLPMDAPEYERILFDALFRTGDDCEISDLDIYFAERLEAAKGSLKKAFSTPERRLLRGKWLAVGWVALALVAFVLMCWLSNPNGANALAGPIVLSLYLAFIASGQFSTVGQKRDEEERGKRIAATVVLWISIIWVFWTMTTTNGGEAPDIFQWLGMLCTALTCWFNGRMRVDSHYRIEQLRGILGLREFILTADEAEVQEQVSKDPGYFGKMLPYAMVLGLSENWARYYESLVPETPEWCMGCDEVYPLWIVHRMERNVVRQFARAEAALRAKRAREQRSSSSGGGRSFSGGGHSGGGGGGGGGGSW